MSYIIPTASGSVHPLQGRADSNNCVVRTYANCLDVFYMQAHELFSEHGRKNNEGMIIWDFIDVYIQSGLIPELFCGSKESLLCVDGFKKRNLQTYDCKISVATMLKMRHYQTGIHAVLTKGHIFCLRNGNVYDTIAIASNTQVIATFTLRK